MCNTYIKEEHNQKGGSMIGGLISIIPFHGATLLFLHAECLHLLHKCVIASSLGFLMMILLSKKQPHLVEKW